MNRGLENMIKTKEILEEGIDKMTSQLESATVGDRQLLNASINRNKRLVKRLKDIIEEDKEW